MKLLKALSKNQQQKKSDIHIELVEYAGYQSAMIGITIPTEAERTAQQRIEIGQRLVKLSDSHSKFSRFLIVYLLISAPRYWWQQFDTYRVGIEKVSSSTMVKFRKKGTLLTKDDFVNDVSQDSIDSINKLLKDNANINEIKASLPEGFLQKRIVSMNMQAFNRIITDRLSHKLQEWEEFILGVFQVLPEEFKRFCILGIDCNEPTNENSTC
jgi:hypothetical protein